MKEQKQTNKNIQKETKKEVSLASKSENKLNIAIIRISGFVGISEDIENTLYRLRLRRKYVCVIINGEDKSLMGLLEKVKYYVAYGEINQETYDKLIKARGKKSAEGGLKPFFRLHPPRKGIKSKLQYPKGVLGNNKKDINKLIERML